MTSILRPADTSVGPGDDGVLRGLTDAAPDIKGVSLDWSYTARLLAFVSAHAAGVLTQAGGLGQAQSPCTSATIPAVGPVATRWGTLKEMF